MDQVVKNADFWRWTESHWVNPEIADWHGRMITAGVDIGSTSTQSVILADGALYAYSSIRTGSSSPDSAKQSMEWALKGTDMRLGDIRRTIGTGYGRVNVPFADRTVTEITCHARGANYIYGPTVRTILDMGGQDCKVIRCNEKGTVEDFLMNDKCAAGTGRGMEVIANLLSVHIEELGELSFLVDEEPQPVCSTCVIFAKSEAMRLMRSGWTKEKVLAAYCLAMAIRITKLLERIKLKPDFAITGGIAKNSGVVRRVERLTGIKALEPSFDTQIAGALGAALIAAESLTKSQFKCAGD